MSFVNDLDDLCDFSKISQRWKQTKVEQIPSPAKTESEAASSKYITNPWNKGISNFELENSLPNNEEVKKNVSKVRSHAPQIIDEDTEQFKIRLEHILNVFKTEATSEFMSMKRSMLDDQKQTIKQDTEKYLQMYELKNNELQQTKEQLAEQMRICNTIVATNEKIAAYCGKMKNANKRQKQLSNVMKAIQQYSYDQKKKKQNAIKATKHYKLNLQSWIFNLWRKEHNIQIRINLQEKLKAQHQKDLDIFMAKFQKEQQLLEQKLFEATSQLDESNKIKVSMQENLKRAFMRGVCALNFEAMNVLNGSTSQMELDSLATNLLMNPVHQQAPQMNDTLNLNESRDVMSRQSQHPSEIIYHQTNRLETNDHKWKDAPLIGQKQLSEITENQSINMSISKLVQQDDFQLDKDEEVNEGKVIKVNFDTMHTQNISSVKKSVPVPQKQQVKQIKQTTTTMKKK